MALQFAMAIPMVINVARVISQQGVKAAVKRYGPEAAKLVNKNMNKLRKRFPDIFGPPAKSRMDPTRSKVVKEKYMDNKGRFYSDEAAKKLKDQAATNRRAIGTAGGAVGGGAVLLTGNEDRDTNIAEAATGTPVERLKNKRPAPITKTKELGSTPGSQLRENAISLARKAEAASKRKAADRSSEKDKGPRSERTETKRPGRFSEEAGKKFFKEKFGIDVTYDKGDELDPLVARGEEPGRKKGGMVQFTKRGGMYNKPARKNSKG